jgi:predicted kinase
MRPTLYIFSGLPGTGKTTIAKEIAQHIRASYFRLDTIEHGLKEVCSINVQGEGYRLTYRIVADNLQIGNNVVVDCCNPWALTRDEWESVAKENGCDFVNIEIVCSDKREHRVRVEERENDIDGFTLPTWEEVQARDYEAWDRARILIDTSGRAIKDCVAELMEKLKFPASAKPVAGTDMPPRA